MPWECDGCGAVYDDPDSERALSHFMRARRPECWGLMEVGGPAWADFHAGIAHPMERVLGNVEQAAMDTGMIVEVLS